MTRKESMPKTAVVTKKKDIHRTPAKPAKKKPFAPVDCLRNKNGQWECRQAFHKKDKKRPTPGYKYKPETKFNAKPIVSKIHYGKASWYGPGFHGKTSACGGKFDKNQISAASPVLPCGTRVVVTNLENQKTIEAVIKDRGPYQIARMGKKSGTIPAYDKGRLIPHPERQFDLSEAAAKRLGYKKDGVVRIAYRVL